MGNRQWVIAVGNRHPNCDPKVGILKAFRPFDDETGRTSFNKLIRVSKELGVRITEGELQEEAFDLLVTDGSREIDLKELIVAMSVLDFAPKEQIQRRISACLALGGEGSGTLAMRCS